VTTKPRTLFPAIGLTAIAVTLLLVRIPEASNAIIELVRIVLIAAAMMGALVFAVLWLVADLDSMRAGTIQPSRPALEMVQVLTSAGTDCPPDVQEEIARLWRDHEMGNDDCYFCWQRGSRSITAEGSEINLSQAYPAIDRYLKALGISDCLIHHWW
jgi:hypothetical protein